MPMPRQDTRPSLPEAAALPDDLVVRRVLDGEVALFEILMRRHNQLVYRVARSILGDPDEAEDVMQDAYVRAYDNLAQFEGRAAFSTWLTRIAVYEAQARRRRRGRLVALPSAPGSAEDDSPGLVSRGPGPDQEAHGSQLRALLTAAVETLPESHRVVFVLRQVEGLSTAETSESLGISQENVRVRLHRARALLRGELERRLGDGARHLYPFHLRRCDRVVDGALARIGDPRRSPSEPLLPGRGQAP
jgi:RNA polymerase sigma-70 factor, ECF subfamily